MKNPLAALLLALGLACIAAPARADSDPYFVIISTLAAQGTGVVTGSTITAVQHPLKFYTLQVKGKTVAASAWDVLLEGSLDGANFSTLVEHSSPTYSDGGLAFSSQTALMPLPVTYIRARIVSRTLGSAAGLNIYVIGSQ